MSDSRTQHSGSPHQVRSLHPLHRPSAFTLIELLVVIGIIAILIGILIPAISYVRTASRATSTQALLAELQGAIERYHMDFNAYPGPLSNDVMYVAVGALAAGNPNHVSNPGGVTFLAGRVSGSENLVLGLLGGLTVDSTIAGTGVSKIVYDPTIVGTGPRNLSYDFPNGLMTAKTNQAKSAYLSSVADLSTNSINNDGLYPGHFRDQSGEANDSTIPEFVDRFPSPMPILYLRARVGGHYYPLDSTGAAAAVTANNNGVITVDGYCRDGVPVVLGPSQYGLSDILSYTDAFTGDWNTGTIGTAPVDGSGFPNAGQAIGDSKDLDYWYGPAVGTPGPGPYSANSLKNLTGRIPHHGLRSITLGLTLGSVGVSTAVVPFDAYPYFVNPAFATSPTPQARAKDTYILISAGPDRVFGTKDDIVSFGPVMP